MKALWVKDSRHCHAGEKITLMGFDFVANKDGDLIAEMSEADVKNLKENGFVQPISNDGAVTAVTEKPPEKSVEQAKGEPEVIEVSPQIELTETEAQPAKPARSRRSNPAASSNA